MPLSGSKKRVDWEILILNGTISIRTDLEPRKVLKLFGRAPLKELKPCDPNAVHHSNQQTLNLSQLPSSPPPPPPHKQAAQQPIPPSSPSSERTQKPSSLPRSITQPPRPSSKATYIAASTALLPHTPHRPHSHTRTPRATSTTPTPIPS